MNIPCLVDTDVLSEARRGPRANEGVRRFFETASETGQSLYLSVVTIGELRRGVEVLRHRPDAAQADRLESWLARMLDHYREQILDFGEEEAQVWGRLRVPHPENALDKQIAATALTHGLTIVSGNVAHFSGLGVELLNPFVD
jgi:toxin FitB